MYDLPWFHAGYSLFYGIFIAGERLSDGNEDLASAVNAATEAVR